MGLCTVYNLIWNYVVFSHKLGHLWKFLMLRPIGAVIFMQRKNLKMCLRSTDDSTDTSEIAKVLFCTICLLFYSRCPCMDVVAVLDASYKTLLKQFHYPAGIWWWRFATF